MKTVRIVFVLALVLTPMAVLAELAPGASADAELGNATGAVAPVLDPQYQALLDALIKILVGAIAAAVAWLLRRLDSYLAERWSLHLEFLRDERIRDAAQWAAAEAEEWARGKAKENPELAPAGAQKLAHAVATVVGRLGIKQELAEKAVLSVLPFFAGRLAGAMESRTTNPATVSPGSPASTADLQPNA